MSTGLLNDGDGLQHKGSYTTVEQSPIRFEVVQGSYECKLLPDENAPWVSFVSNGMRVEVTTLTQNGWTYIFVDKERTWRCWIPVLFP